ENSTTKTPQAKSLLALPGELRNIIWESILTSHSPIQLLTPTWRQSHGFCASLPALRNTPQPASAQICRALRSEVLSIHYSINTFHIGRIPVRKPSFQNVHTHDQYVSALRQWRGSLKAEPAAKFLRSVEVDLVLSIRHERRVDCFYDQAFGFVARMGVNGIPNYRLTGPAQDFCLCWLQCCSQLKDEDVVDGRRLVDAALDVCQSLYPSVQQVQCGRCGKTRLIR
ncbi:hypothetical protein DOTSEDRAFT_100427, partial [Dothistroma septosporum NZE10]